MHQVTTLIILLSLASLDAAAQEEKPPPAKFFSVKRVDFWKDGKEVTKGEDLRRPVDGTTAVSIWAEPIRLPDGRFVTYVPPKAVLDFLEEPSKENARKYLEWQKLRIDKMRKAAKVLSEIQAESAAKSADVSREPPKFVPVEILYFKKPGCPFCVDQDRILEDLKKELPNLTIRAFEPGEEPDLWKRYGVSAVPALVVRGGKERESFLRGLSNRARIMKAIDEVSHEDR